LADLTVRAPFDGLVVAPLINELQDRYLQQGEEIATVMRYDPLIIRATVDQSNAGLLFQDEPIWNPFPALAKIENAYNASAEDVAAALSKNGVAFNEEPPANRRLPGERVKRITIPQGTLFGQTGAVAMDFDNDRISTITATFHGTGAYEAIKKEHQEKFGNAEDGKTPGQKKAHWMAEKDRAALDIDLTEQPGQTASADPSTAAGPTTTLSYKILGRKVDVRLASKRGENLTARVLTRIPAGLPNVPHASLTHLGGGDQQNDPKDQTGTKVQTPVFEVRLRLDNANLQNLPGQRAYVRFTMEKNQPLLTQWMRKFWQLVQTQSAQNKWM
jgi:hypothetical protein